MISNIHNTQYVIFNNKTNRFIGVDQETGGNPYDCDLDYAKFWEKKSDAREYYEMFKLEDWELHEVYVLPKTCGWFDKKEEYEEYLKSLK